MKAIDSTEDQFKAFHQANPQVYAHIVETCRGWKNGEHHYPHGSISDAVGQARWGLHIKVSGTFNTFYADLIMEQEPDLKGFFKRIKRRRA
jgi:hypothetical protein